MKYTCPVCGFPDLDENPYPPFGGGSYEFRQCCGFQFGVTDDDRGISHQQWRNQWVQNGMQWDSEGYDPPSGWDPRAQLLAAGFWVDS